MESEVKINESRRLRKIVEQLKQVGWSKVENIDQDFQKLTLIYRDQNTEKAHELTMTLPYTYPVDPPRDIFCQDIPPASFKELWNSNGNVEENKTSQEYELISIYSNFVSNIEKYRPLRRMLRDLDENTWVLDPPKGPARKSLEYTYRRVAISKGVSLQIELKPEAFTNQLPGLKFLGSDENVRPLREMLCDNLENYDSDYTLVQNLERVLELEFPLEDCAQEQDDLNLDCAICYSYRLGDQFPTEACDDPSGCRKVYHEACLFEWLRSLPEQCSKMSFRTMFGSCPYCEKQISCKISN